MVLKFQINSSVSKNVKFFLVAGIFDKPAKAAVLNMKASNGFYGCTKCLKKIKKNKMVKHFLNQNFKINYFFYLI
jgi:hypothetical protein